MTTRQVAFALLRAASLQQSTPHDNSANEIFGRYYCIQIFNSKIIKMFNQRNLIIEASTVPFKGSLGSELYSHSRGYIPLQGEFSVQSIYPSYITVEGEFSCGPFYGYFKGD